MTTTRDTFATNTPTAVAGSGSSVSIGSAEQYVLVTGSTPSYMVTEGDPLYPMIGVGSGYGGNYYRLQLAYTDDTHCMEILWFENYGTEWNIYRDGATISMSQNNVGARSGGTDTYQASYTQQAIIFGSYAGRSTTSHDGYPVMGGDYSPSYLGLTGTTAVASGGLSIVRAGGITAVQTLGASWTQVATTTTGKIGVFGVIGGAGCRRWSPKDENSVPSAEVLRVDPDSWGTGMVSATIRNYQPGFRLGLRRDIGILSVLGGTRPFGRSGYLVSPTEIQRRSSSNGVLNTYTATGVPTFANGDRFSAILSSPSGASQIELQRNGATYFTTSVGSAASGSGYYFGWWQDARDSDFATFPVGGTDLDSSALNAAWTRLDEIYWSPTGDPYVEPAPLSLKLADGSWVAVGGDARFKVKSQDGTWWHAAPDTSGARALKLKLADGTWVTATFLIPP